MLLVAFFTFPETAFVRDTGNVVSDSVDVPAEKAGPLADVEVAAIAKKESYLSSLRLFHKTLTQESFLKLAWRPLGLICLPHVLWAALVQSVTIGYTVKSSHNKCQD